LYLSSISIPSKILGKIIMNWATQNECRLILSGAGISSQKQNTQNGNDTPVIQNERRVYAATNTYFAAKIAKENDFIPLKADG
jgi:hypothetical protein